MPKKIEKIREGLYIKKSFDGYRVVYPTKNDDGTTNWFNILTGGTWWKLIKLAILLLFILGLSWSYMIDTKTCRELVSNPCKIFPNIDTYKDYCFTPLFTYPTLNISGVIDNEEGG